jgi:hypothetical protein
VRNIFLPELLSINIKNYTLYPNGLDFTFDFVKGFNLVLGGNGMGKTTFVSLIKYALIGNYRKQFDYTKSYKDNKIEKRERNSDDFFKNRADNSIETNSEPKVTINFKVNETVFTVTRGLKDIKIVSLFIDGIEIEGDVILESKYEVFKNKNNEISSYLSFILESELEKFSNISFDDLIFFVNYILFFGEDHKTILWDDYVQKELINTFFNSPELNEKRREAERLEKYFDSRARHRSEDRRAIRKVLKPIEEKKEKRENGNLITEIIELKERIESLNSEEIKIHEERKRKQSILSQLESKRNSTSEKVNEIENHRNSLINKFSYTEYRTQHKNYDVFLKNIQTNHICPMCNSQSEELYKKVKNDPNNCWVCNTELINQSDLNSNNKDKLNELNNEFSSTSATLKNIIEEIKKLDMENIELDSNFKKVELEKRKSLVTLRELEFENSQENNPSELLPFYDEMERLKKEQDEFVRKSQEQRDEANRISKLIEDTVLKNVQSFSNLFSVFANKFLGVECKLTYEKLGNDDLKKFYPIIDGSTRESEFELSESQRFFIDHAFRMSILSHFYTTPTFYIVETPDSSLDLSYEKNAADVFSSFLNKPYSLIITSNLNNSAFVNYIMQNDEKEKAVVRLFEIAKKSTIQENNQELLQLYNSITNG